jgi:hypothetical protein
MAPVLGLVMLLPAQAAAQGSTGFPMGDVGQVLRQAEQPLTQWAAPPSPLTRLSRASRDWVRDETRRQVETPGEPVELMLAADKALARDVLRLAKRERINPHEILTAVVLKIVMDAEAELAGGPKTPETAAKLARASEHRKTVVDWSSQNSLYMAAM